MRLLLDEPQSRFELIKRWLIRAAAALLFFSVGMSKFSARSQWVSIFAQIGFGQWFRYFTGVLQILGALLVLISETFAVGIIILACTMAGAMACWVFLLGEPFNAFFPGALLLGLVFIGGEDVIELASLYRKRWEKARNK